MVIYKVTIRIKKDREEDWTQYMHGHIKDVLNTRHFVDYNFRKIFPNQDSNNPESKKFSEYQIEYYCTDISEYQAYEANGASQLKAEHSKLFKDAFTAEREVYEYLDIFKEKYLRDNSDQGGVAEYTTREPISI